MNWHGNRVFEVSWGGMGYSISQLFRVEDPKSGKVIDNVLEHDAQRDLYVAFFLDFPGGTGVEVGRAFVAQDRQPERFDLGLEFVYVSEAQLTIESTEIGETEIIVIHTRGNGEEVRETISPNALRLE